MTEFGAVVAEVEVLGMVTASKTFFKYDRSFPLENVEIPGTFFMNEENT